MNFNSRLALPSIALVAFIFVSCSNRNTANEPNTSDTTSKGGTRYTPFDASRSVTKVSPDLYQVLADTLNIRVMQGAYKPGDSSIMHAHPDFALYVLQGSTVELTGTDGSKQNIEFKKGMAVVLPATTHSAKNIGNSTLEVVVVEVDRPRD